MGTLFTQYKQWIVVTPSRQYTGTKLSTVHTAGGLGDTTSTAGLDKLGGGLGNYFERVSGGEVAFSMAEAALANSRGMVYRSTRFRVSELSLENTMDIETFAAFAQVIEAFRKDGNQKLSVTRTMVDGEKGVLTYFYENCSVSSPPTPDDGDVARDSEFMMMRMRLQPEKVTVKRDGKELMRFDPYDSLSDSYFTADEGAANGGI